MLRREPLIITVVGRSIGYAAKAALYVMDRVEWYAASRTLKK